MDKPDVTICPNCHAANESTSAFCWTCGNKLSAESGLPPIDKMKLVTNAVQIIGVGLILFVVGGFIIWVANGGLYKDNSGTKPTSAPSDPSPLTGSRITVGTNITLDGSNPDPTIDMKEITVAVSEFYLEAISKIGSE
jgi:hypothetical protein